MLLPACKHTIYIRSTRFVTPYSDVTRIHFRSGKSQQLNNLYTASREYLYTSKDSSFMMSGETLEDYFRHLDLDETRRKFLESIKEGKQEENGLEDNNNKNGNRKEYSQTESDWYSIYLKRF